MAPVHWAAKENEVEALEMLLDEDPRLIEAKDPKTPLFYASQAGWVDVARLLLDRGADVNYADDDGWTALIWASFEGRVGVVELLLARGADPLPRQIFGQTVLMMAAYARGPPNTYHEAVIRLLIKDGRTPVDARDKHGCTALYLACAEGYSDRARVLLMEGMADPTIPTNAGRTPMAVAQRRGNQGCIRLLQWYEGELHRAFLLSKARAVLDATHTITKAPDKAQAQTQAEAQRAREEAAPAWLRGRVVGGEALPVLGLMNVVWQAEQDDDDDEREREEELCAVCGWLVRGVSGDLYLELMEGLRYRR